MCKEKREMFLIQLAGFLIDVIDVTQREEHTLHNLNTNYISILLCTVYGGGVRNYIYLDALNSTTTLQTRDLSVFVVFFVAIRFLCSTKNILIYAILQTDHAH